MAPILASCENAHEWQGCHRSQEMCQTPRVLPFQTVAAYAPPGVGMLAVGIVAEVFAPHGEAAPGFDFTLCGDRPGTVPTDVGVPLTVTHGLDHLAGADLVLVLPG